MPNTSSVLDLVDAVYLMSILADQPRWIDRYIDYFGGGAGDLRGGKAGCSVASDARPRTPGPGSGVSPSMTLRRSDDDSAALARDRFADTGGGRDR